MKRNSMNSLLVLFGVMFLLAGCGDSANKETAANTSTEPKNGSSVTVFGEVGSYSTKDIYIDFSASIENIYVKEGQKVKKGDKLIGLDFDQIQYEIDKKNNELEQKNAQYNDINSSISVLQKEINILKEKKDTLSKNLNNNTDPELKTLQIDLDKATKAVQTAQADYDTNKNLYNNSAISKQELDKYSNTLYQSKKDKEKTLASIEKVKSQIKESISDLNISLNNKEYQLAKLKGLDTTVNKNNVDSDKLDLGVMNKRLDKGYIKDNNIICDINNGIISKISCNSGQILGANGPSNLISIIDCDDIQVVADVPQEYIKDVKVGASCEIIPYNDKSQTINGKVERISEMSIQKNGETIIQVYVSYDKQTDLLKPGYSADVKIST